MLINGEITEIIYPKDVFFKEFDQADKTSGQAFYRIFVFSKKEWVPAYGKRKQYTDQGGKSQQS